MVASAIAVAVSEHSRPQLVNLSFAGAEDETRKIEPPDIKAALDALSEESVVVVAAGNDGSPEIHYPGGLENVKARIIAVGAVDQTSTEPYGAAPPVAEFSNHGSWVDCFADGVQVLGPHCYFDESHDGQATRPAQNFRGWALWSGTSFAAATVTGRIARFAIDRDVSLREAAQHVVDEARRIPTPGDRPDDRPLWKPYVRGIGSTWGEITVKPPPFQS